MEGRQGRSSFPVRTGPGTFCGEPWIVHSEPHCATGSWVDARSLRAPVSDPWRGVTWVRLRARVIAVGECFGYPTCADQTRLGRRNGSDGANERPSISSKSTGLPTHSFGTSTEVPRGRYEHPSPSRGSWGWLGSGGGRKSEGPPMAPRGLCGPHPDRFVGFWASCLATGAGHGHHRRTDLVATGGWVPHSSETRRFRARHRRRPRPEPR